jgi:hypothetical protein
LLLTVKSTAAKATHITQVLTERTKKRLRSGRRGVVLGLGEDNVVLHTENDHPYTGISIAEWSAANCRLMAHLLATGALARADVEYYLAYSTQIYEYAALYEWEAVLDFDHLYRERQAVHGFVWGHIPPNMELSLVHRPRRHPGKPISQHPPRPSQWRSDRRAPQAPSRDRADCWLYMAHGKCPFGAKCRYDHPVGGSQPPNPPPPKRD